MRKLASLVGAVAIVVVGLAGSGATTASAACPIDTEVCGESPVQVTRPLRSGTLFTGPTLSLFNDAVIVSLTGPNIQFPNDPLLPPNPILPPSPIHQITVLGQD